MALQNQIATKGIMGKNILKKIHYLYQNIYLYDYYK